MRARQLEVATLLARGKMVELEAEYERKGFRDFDESEEGTFEDGGPPGGPLEAGGAPRRTVELGPRTCSRALTGGEGARRSSCPPPRPGARSSRRSRRRSTAHAPGACSPGIGEQLKKGVARGAAHGLVAGRAARRVLRRSSRTWWCSRRGETADAARARGFTLVEVLIAMAITAAHGAHDRRRASAQVDRAARGRARAGRALRRRAPRALAPLARGLDGVPLRELRPRTGSASAPTLFVGREDELLFTTMAHERLYRDAKESDQAVVEYVLDARSRPLRRGGALPPREAAPRRRAGPRRPQGPRRRPRHRVPRSSTGTRSARSGCASGRRARSSTRSELPAARADRARAEARRRPDREVRRPRRGSRSRTPLGTS